MGKASRLGALLVLAACGRAPESAPAPTAVRTAVPAGYRGLDTVPSAGRIEGVVTLTGITPRLRGRTVTGDHPGCGGPSERPNLSLQLGDDGEVANAVVSLVGIAAGKKPGTGRPELDQRGCEFLPYVQVVPLGSTLVLRNSDPVSHNVHAWDSRSESLFNVGMAVQGMSVDQPLLAKGPVKVKCDVHPWMFAWLWVGETPYMAVTDEAGRFELTGVPPGTYQLQVWHELLESRQLSVTVPPDGTARVEIDLNVGS